MVLIKTKVSVSRMPILGESVVVVLHTCELHEVDDCDSVVPCSLLSDSYSPEVFTSGFNIPNNRYLMSEASNPQYINMPTGNPQIST